MVTSIHRQPSTQPAPQVFTHSENDIVPIMYAIDISGASPEIVDASEGDYCCPRPKERKFTYLNPEDFDLIFQGLNRKNRELFRPCDASDRQSLMSELDPDCFVANTEHTHVYVHAVTRQLVYFSLIPVTTYEEIYKLVCNTTKSDMEEYLTLKANVKYNRVLLDFINEQEEIINHMSRSFKLYRVIGRFSMIAI